MRAAVVTRFGGPDVLQLVEHDEPQRRRGEVLVRVAATSVNPGDFALREGTLRVPGAPRPPFVPGMDVAGVVVASDDVDLPPGARVFGCARLSAGASAELAVLPAAQLARHALPADVAGCAGIAGLTALEALEEKAPVVAGQRVLVRGAAGGVGHLAVQVARLRGATVVAGVRDEHKAFVRGLGADEVVALGDDEGDGYDVVLDCASGISPARARRLVKPTGTCLVIAPTPRFFVAAALSRLTPGARLVVFFVTPTRSRLERLASLLRSGDLRLHVERSFPLAALGEAHRAAATSPRRGKVAVVVAPEPDAGPAGPVRSLRATEESR